MGGGRVATLECPEWPAGDLNAVRVFLVGWGGGIEMSIARDIGGGGGGVTTLSCPVATRSDAPIRQDVGIPLLVTDQYLSYLYVKL